MEPLLDDDRIASDAACLREAVDAMERIMARASEAGVNDISQNEVLYLLAAARHMDPRASAGVMSDMKITHQALLEAIDRLVVRGYLEIQNDPRAPGRTAIGVTDRGNEVYRIVVDIVINKRWNDIPLRPGDIIVSSFPKCGTTWVQMICALLILQTADLPAPLPDLSPWLEDQTIIRDKVFATLAAQRHRRFMKTHAPLGRVPVDQRITYIAIGRHPLDSALSYYYQLCSEKKDKQGSVAHPPPSGQLEPNEALLHWMDPEGSPVRIRADRTLPSMVSMMRHLTQAWARRDEPNVVLLRYEDLCADLHGQMRCLAGRLDINVPDAAWPGLVKAATFEQMRAAADRLQPVADLADPKMFFRSGRAGSGREVLTGAELARYHECAAQLAPPDLLAWLHGE
jgi:aryl sulfotransferase